MFEELIKETVSGLSGDLQAQLLHEVQNVGATLITHDVSNVVAHNLLKAVDGIVAAAVKVADSATATKLAKAYTDHLDTHLVALVTAIDEYIPLQVAVEQAKHAHGNDSAAANAERKVREAGIAQIKAEVSATFGDLIGKHLSHP